MHDETGGKPQGTALARTLGPGSIILMGIGTLLGGGIFTLLGPAAGLAGPGLFIAMILGATIAFLNLQMYLALGTTFPEAGGGYLWVRKGLGDFQGFLAGWLSWFAHAAACGLYALSFGYYARELFSMFGVDLHFALGPITAEKIFALVVILLFGYLNWRGTKVTGTAGNVITVGLLGILLAFVAAGWRAMAASPAPLAPFTPLLPNGVLGIIAAASFFYIAFEGSEVQVQAGEETKDPARDLKIGLLVSWAVVSLLYVLISIVLIGATPADGMPVWQLLSGLGEGAVVRAAAGFMPFGAAIMTVGGLLANLAALNTTIYSSSHVSFALARDNNIWSHLSRIHFKNYTPHVAVAFSVVLIAAMVVALPLFDVASAASLLFVLLFLQLNLAGITIHFKFPQTKWKYRIPLFPATPLLAVALYSLLALTMLRINLNAWMITGVWILVGLVNYYAYALMKGRELFENEIVFEEAMRAGPKTGKRVLLPISPDLSVEEKRYLVEIALALASRFDGELVLVKVHEKAPADGPIDGATLAHDRQTLEQMKEWVEDFNRRTPGVKKDVNFHNLILAGANVTDMLLQVIKMEECDLLILNWDGYTQTKGTVFGSKIDRILREAHCDLLVVKDPKPFSSVLLAANPKAKNPSLKLIGEVVSAIKEHFSARTGLFCVTPEDVPSYYRPEPDELLRKLDLERNAFDAITFVPARSIVRALIDGAKSSDADLVVVGAARPKFLKDIRFGSIPESLSKHLPTSLFIVKGHQGIAEAFTERLGSFFSRGKRGRP